MVKLMPLRSLFKSGKKWKVQGTKSGEHEGWAMDSNFSFTRVLVIVCMCVFVHPPRTDVYNCWIMWPIHSFDMASWVMMHCCMMQRLLWINLSTCIWCFLSITEIGWPLQSSFWIFTLSASDAQNFITYLSTVLQSTISSPQTACKWW